MNSFIRRLIIAASVAVLSAVAHGQCNQMQKVTVSTLPSATTFPTCTVQVVDGNSASDCTVGSGSFNVICSPHAGVWVAQASNGNVNGSGTTGFVPMWTGANNLGNSPLSVASSQIVSADPYNAPVLISPVIGLDPNFSADSIYMQAGGTTLPVISYSAFGNHLHFNTLGSGGSVDMFVGNANFASYRFLVTSLVLGELNGGVGNFAIDFAPSSSGVAAPIPSGTRWHLGTAGALSGSFFQDITAKDWHFNSGDVGASTATDVAIVTHLGQIGTKPVTFATLPACASGTEGQRAAVTDSTASTFGSTITGGGGNHVPGYCDGTSWKVY